MTERPTVAVFRPDDGRLAAAVETLEELGAEPLPDPLLEIDSTGALPRDDADYVILTSKTGAELVAEAGWESGDASLCAIGETTAGALEAAGYNVDVVPEEFSSTGLVERLHVEIDGARVEVARSDHGSVVLLDGFENAGAYVHETVLYRLERPKSAGASVEAAAAGELDVALFTSSLTVEHFLEIAAERGEREAVVAGLNAAVVGAIGEPTAETARAAGISVDVIPARAEFGTLARAVLEDE